MKRNKYIVLICISIFSVTLFSSMKYNSQIDWKEGVIKAHAEYSVRTNEKGIPYNFGTAGAPTLNEGRMIAYQNAEQAAREMIAKEIMKLRIDSDYTYGDIVRESAYTRRLLGEVLSNEVKTVQIPAGFYSAESRAELKISSIISTLPFEYPGEDMPDFGKNKIPTDYTSVIIDVRGLNMKPMLFPSIYTEEGIALYGRRNINIQCALKTGIVTYCKNEREAQNHFKAGDRPYYTTALNSLKNSPVISNEDVDRIMASAATRNAMKECRIIFIID